MGKKRVLLRGVRTTTEGMAACRGEYVTTGTFRTFALIKSRNRRRKFFGIRGKRGTVYQGSVFFAATRRCELRCNFNHTRQSTVRITRRGPSCSASPELA